MKLSMLVDGLKLTCPQCFAQRCRRVVDGLKRLRHTLALVAAVCLAGVMPAKAQTVTDLNEGLQVTAGATEGEFTLSWWGKTERTYFIQTSDDLMSWTYLPYVETGVADVAGINFTNTETRQFWRLRYTDAPTGGNALTSDFDDDGLGNQAELDLGLDPFDLDSDHDGYPDGEEVEYNTNPLSAASVPNENLGSNDDPAEDALPVYLFVQSKWVDNDWYAGYAAPSSDVTWFDDAGVSGQLSYQGATPQWAAKLGLLGYPAITRNPDNWTQSNNYCESLAELHEYSSGGNTTGHADIVYRRVGLYCNPTTVVTRQPWDVYRKYFKYRKTLPYVNTGSVPPVFSDVDMHPLIIKKWQTMTAGADALLLEPPMTLETTSRDRVGWISATPYYAPLALDMTGQNHTAQQTDATEQTQWLTLPAGTTGTPGAGVFMMMYQTSTLDPVSYQAQGAGVTPTTSTNPVPSWPFYYETYSSTSTEAAEGTLKPALNDGTGTLTAAATPLLKFDVKVRRELYVTIQPIGLDQGGGNILHPQGLPADPVVAKAQIEAYLESVYGPQCNVHPHVELRTQVNVAFDVGLGSTAPEDYKGWGRLANGDGKLSIVQGQFTDEGMLRESAEEKAILSATGAGPDAAADITIYWVAGTGMNVYGWKNQSKELLFDLNDMVVIPVLGWSGKAVDAFRKEDGSDTRPRVLWLTGLSTQDYQNHNDAPYHAIAHELAHALGNLKHTSDIYGVPGGDTAPDPNEPNKALSGFSPYSDNCLRLMSGISNSKRRNGPKQLSKLERDRINNFPYANP